MKRLLIVLALVLVVGAAGAVAYWSFTESQLSSFASTAYGEPGRRLVDIPAGSSPRTVAQRLYDGKVISSADLFYRYLRQEKLGPRLRAGEYEFEGALTPAAVAATIVKGEVKLYRFTVPEGLRVDEVLPILAASELTLPLDQLRALAARPSFIRSLGVPADSLEGFLYPDTYSFPRGATPEGVLKKMVQRSIAEFEAAPPGPGVKLGLLEGMTLASIVEKETGALEPEQRGRIACVFHNRLRLGMKLQTDPTVLYAKLLRTGTFSRNITRADLLAEHPYNTYTVKGLPPGPIASPGQAAIRAAMNPVVCDDLYFVSRNDGTSVFCPDLRCHNENVQRFQVEYFRKKK